jgi:hypothetical protein
MRLFKLITIFLLLNTSSYASDFYKDKTLKIYSNSAVGSFPDLTARIFAKHLEIHIPKISSVIVVNKPGGSGVIAPNYLSEVAINDGTNIGYFSNILLSKYISSDAQLKLDPQIATTLFANLRSSTALVSSNKIKSIYDISNSDLNFGLTSNPSAVNIVERLAFSLFDVKTTYISGYKSNSDILRSVEQGETDIVIHSANQYNGNFYDTWVKTKKLTPLWVPTFQKNVDILPINEVYYNIFKKEPQGLKWDSYKFVESIQGQQLIILSTAPKEAINTLNKAIEDIKDSESFKRDISLTLGNDVIYYFSLEADKYIKSIKPSKEILDYLNNH